MMSSSGQVKAGVCEDTPACPISWLWSSSGICASTWEWESWPTCLELSIDLSHTGTEGGADGWSRIHDGIAGAGAKSGCRVLASISDVRVSSTDAMILSSPARGCTFSSCRSPAADIPLR